MKGSIISIEGINGVGKTYYEHRLRKEISDNKNIVFVSEVSDRVGNGLDNKIIDVLSHTNNRFFRMGFPLTETFLLLSLKMYDYENIIIEALQEGKVVIEDRSIDTIAIYQAIILCENQVDKTLDMANEIYSLASKYRRPPDLTFLIEDNIKVTIDCAQKRNGNNYSENEKKLIYDVNELYLKFAKLHKDRIICLNKQTMSQTEILNIMKRNILERIDVGESK